MSKQKEINKRKHQIEKMMVDLLEQVTKDLLDKVRSGEATSNDVSNAIRLLKENDIDIHITKGEPLGILEEVTLPFESDTKVS